MKKRLSLIIALCAVCVCLVTGVAFAAGLIDSTPYDVTEIPDTVDIERDDLGSGGTVAAGEQADFDKAIHDKDVVVNEETGAATVGYDRTEIPDTSGVERDDLSWEK